MSDLKFKILGLGDSARTDPMSETDILPAPEIKPPPVSEMPKWEREKRAFRRLLPSLLSTHGGQYVAVHN
ncbi:MAG: hypothetical protein ACREIV_15365, partial [Planctomycetaceae bacterium]